MQTWFYGNEPQWFRRDRMYKVWVTPRAICGGFLAHQVFQSKPAEDPGSLSSLKLSELAIGVLERMLERGAELEVRYEGIAPDSPMLLEKHPLNFQYDRPSLRGWSIREKHSKWLMLHVVKLTLHLGNGRKRRFLCPFPGQAEHVAEMMERFLPGQRVG